MSEVVDTLNKLFTRETWLDQFAEPVQKIVNQIFMNSGPVGTKIADFLNGTWLGHPLHPVLTDIPVGAWTAALTLDAMEASTDRPGVGLAADAAVAVGVAGAIGSAVSGLADWQHTIGESRRTGFTHASLNTLALSLFIGSMIARSTHNRGLGRALALAGYGVVSLGAYLGGDLVYNDRIGVDHAPEEETIETKDYVAVMAENQLPENQLTKAMMNDIPLVLLRRGDRIYALANTCAHLGGPLDEGQLLDGSEGQPVVQCPWHQSHFDMRNGNALKGPTAYPEPCFDVRIRNGQIEVRHFAGQG